MSRYDDELKLRLRRINARITAVEMRYGKDSSIYKRIVSTIQRAGNEGGTRFKKSMFSGSLRQLSVAENALRTVEVSKYLTKEGRKQIGEKARETFRNNELFSTYSDVTIEKMWDVFANSSALKKVQEVFHSSEVFIDEIMRYIEMSDSDMRGKTIAKRLDKIISIALSETDNISDFVEMFWDSIEKE